MLDVILANKRSEIAALRQTAKPAEYERFIADLGPVRSLKRALTADDDIAVIAEIKRKSPSKGDLLMSVDPADMAGKYQTAGASAISVLTDSRFFAGSLADLSTVRCTVNLPVLRKDFILDEIQLYEARANGADAVLLIVAALEEDKLISLYQFAMELGLEVLVEVHDEDEVYRAVDAGAEIIGINNRDLGTFRVSLDTTLRLRKHIPRSSVVVAESGIHTREDIDHVSKAAVNAVLVGESIMTSPDPVLKIKQLIGAPA